MLALLSAAPLEQAGIVIQLHVLAALAALALGIWQLSDVKGTASHRLRGWCWVTAMAVVAASSLFIHEIRLFGPWSPIHLLSLMVLAQLPIAVLAARRGDIARHRRYMIGMFAGGLVLAGLFTLLPGRVMHAVLFGG